MSNFEKQRCERYLRKTRTGSPIDFNKFKIFHIRINQQVRKEVLSAVAEDAGLIGTAAYNNSAIVSCLKRDKKVDCFPAALIEILDCDEKMTSIFIIPVGPAKQSTSNQKLFSWTHLVASINSDPENFDELLNVVVAGQDTFVDCHLPKVNARLERIIEQASMQNTIISEFCIVENYKALDLDSINLELENSRMELEETIATLNNANMTISEIETEPSIAFEMASLQDALPKPIIKKENTTDSFSQTEKQQENSQKSEDVPDQSTDEQSRKDSSDSLDNEAEIPPKNHEMNQMTGSTKLTLPIFKESENIKTWVKQSKFILTHTGVTDERKQVGHMSSRLPDHLQRAVILEMSKLDDAEITLDTFTNTLTRCCHKDNFEYENLLKKIRFSEEKHVNLRNFYYSVEELVRTTLDTKDEDLIKNIAFKEFLEKLPKKIQNSEMLLEYRKDSKRTHQERIEKCIELFNKYKNGEFSEVNNFNKSRKDLNNFSSKTTCNYCKKPGHLVKDCRKLAYVKKQEGNQKFSITCHNCGKKGHRAKECRSKQVQNNPIVCNSCGKKGHKSFECRSKPNQNNQKKFEKGNSQSDSNNKKINCSFCHKAGHYESQCYKKQNQSRREGYNKKGQ